MNKTRKLFLLSSIFMLAFLILIIVLRLVDVSNAGATNVPVGLSTINSAVWGFIGENITLYKISNYVGYIPLVFVALYAIYGLVQLVQKKSLFKVEPGILILGGLLGVSFIIYILFNLIAINYRPVFINGELEPSFPSSHTMITICVCLSIIIFNISYYNQIKWFRIMNYVLTLIVSFVVAARFLSGVHWITDIIAGFLISASLICCYSGLILRAKNTKKLSSKNS